MSTPRKDRLYYYTKVDKFLYENLINKTIWFSKPSSFNDPFDCNLSYREDYSFGEIEECKKRFLKRNPNTLVEMKKYLF